VIYDLLGRKLKTLMDADQKPGNYTIIWDAQDEQEQACASGIYFGLFTINNKTFIRKMILLR